VPLQASVEVPDPPRVTLVGVRVHVRPVEGDIVAAIVTAPVKPCSAGRAVTVIVDDPTVPLFTVKPLGLAVTVKSRIVYVTGAECDRSPFMPVTVTV
jgi:hypothetical protein